MSVTVTERPQRPLIRVAAQDDRIKLTQLRRDGLPVPKQESGFELTITDFYCGGGGSTSGIHLVPGMRVRMASNHADVAIRTHQANFPDTDHEKADITGLHPRKFPRTDGAWFSPECTFWTCARGDKCDYDDKPVQLELGADEDEDDRPVSNDLKQRSRAQMRDVVKFARYHQYKFVIVENVTDILKWKNFNRWLADMRAEGYLHKVVILNSAFAQALGPGAPQLRDRVYIIFWKAQYKEPNWSKWLRPRSYCPSCDSDVAGIQVIKPGKPRIMRYGPQYFYRCPKSTCRGRAVLPYASPALAAIDLSKPGKRIGDRKRPLAEATRARIGAGLRQHGPRPDPFLEVLRSGRPRYIDPGAEALATIVADGANHMVIDPQPMLVPTGGTWRDGASPLSQPLPTRTTRESDALVVPLRNNGVARPAADHPLVTIAAGGTHQALVMRNNTPRGNPGQMCTPVDEPLRALTTAGHQSLVQWEQHRVYAYDTGDLRSGGYPLPAQTTVEGDALVQLAEMVDDCFLRMLTVDEIRAGMAFYPDYLLLGDSNKENVKMLGNAVTPCTARDLVACVTEAILGVEYDVSDYVLAG